MRELQLETNSRKKMNRIFEFGIRSESCRITLAFMVVPSAIVRTAPWPPGSSWTAAMRQPSRIAPAGRSLASASIRSFLFKHRSSVLGDRINETISGNQNFNQVYIGKIYIPAPIMKLNWFDNYKVYVYS
jgi:hypothetical protein